MVILARNLKNVLQQWPRTSAMFSVRKNSNSSEVHLSYLTEDKNQGIAIIGLNKPQTRNAFNGSMVQNFNLALDYLNHDKNVRVVIIRSLIPGIFCAGADLKERATLTPVEVNRFVTSLRTLFRSIENLPMPVISAIDGVALGGGLEMALACDIRTVADTAKLGLVETKLAIIPGAGGTQRLSRIVGPAFAKELIYTGRVLSGDEAKELGICNHVIEQNKENDAAFLKALEIAKEILPNGPIGVRMAKRAIDCGLQVDLNTGYAIEEACYAQLIPTRDRLEGLQAFAEKRAPKYKGE